MKPIMKMRRVKSGVLFDARAQPYTGGKIQLLARSLGWDGDLVLGFRHESYWPATYMAEVWLNKNMVWQGKTFGTNKNGHWGLFKTDETEQRYEISTR